MADDFRTSAQRYITDLGGKDNIATIINCATRLRIIVNDVQIVASDSQFKFEGAINVSIHNNLIQIIVGLNAPQIIEEMHRLLNISDIEFHLDEYGLTENEERAKILYECFGLPENIQRVTVLNDTLIVQVVDPDWIDPYDVMLQLDIGIEDVRKNKCFVYIKIWGALVIAKELNILISQNHKTC
ncbi:PTS transporter subunit EIIB [Loigolactobacillus coryniformis]|uniref:PTS transporter subunit EIIB n=1 Tax=Loigolactobacillus coryniformis TaxID=1610 RepID=UPI002341F1BC|nr:PTS transporter subunit EIIB [Loigolactobacillus coryniformis]MDC4186477.1 PTS transporter subunit EIIB [Loigolactobacillus coryniformis]